MYISWNSNTISSNSLISFTDFSSLKAAFFFTFTLHLYFEGILLKCILADKNLPLCSHLHHPDHSSLDLSPSLSHDCFPAGTFLVLLCQEVQAPFSVLGQPSVQPACLTAGCNMCCSPLVPQLLRFLSEILQVERGLLGLVTCLLPWLTKRAVAPGSDMKIHRWMTELLWKSCQGPIFLLWNFVSNSNVFCSWCVPYSGEAHWKAVDFSLFCPPV